MKDATKKMFNDALNSGQIIFWEDPGHGWLQVPLPLTKTLENEVGLKISGFSYRDKNYAYLEEDCDMGAFINCFPWIRFRDVITDRRYEEHIFIRSLNGY